MAAASTRRGLFAAPALVSAALLPGISRADSGSNDCELLAVARQWSVVDAELARVDAALDDLDDTLVFPAAPEALRWREGDYFMSLREPAGGVIPPRAVQEFAGVFRSPPPLFTAQVEMLQGRAAEVVGASAAHTRACAMVRQRAGWFDLVQRQADLCDRQTVLERRAAELRAVTAEGQAFKARLVERYSDLPREPVDLADRLLASLLSDLQTCVGVPTNA